jgi:hypothetical protein
MLALSSGCVAAAPSGPPPESYPLQRELGLDDGNGVRASFRPARTARYFIALQFRLPIQEDDTRDLVNRAASGVGRDRTPTRFDFTWRVFEADRVVAQGTGHNGATGVIDSGRGGLGGDDTGRALTFGTFEVEANHAYELEFTPDAGFEPVLRSRPVLQVGLQTLPAP